MKVSWLSHVFYLCFFIYIFIFLFVNSQARLKAQARGRTRLKAIMARTPCTLVPGVQGNEAGILWGGHITLLFSDSLDWHTGKLWSCLKATQPKDFSLQPWLVRCLHVDQMYFFSSDLSRTGWLQSSLFIFFWYFQSFDTMSSKD